MQITDQDVVNYLNEKREQITGEIEKLQEQEGIYDQMIELLRPLTVKAPQESAFSPLTLEITPKQKVEIVSYQKEESPSESLFQKETEAKDSEAIQDVSKMEISEEKEKKYVAVKKLKKSHPAIQYQSVPEDRVSKDPYFANFKKEVGDYPDLYPNSPLSASEVAEFCRRFLKESYHAVEVIPHVTDIISKMAMDGLLSTFELGGIIFYQKVFQTPTIKDDKPADISNEVKEYFIKLKWHSKMFLVPSATRDKYFTDINSVDFARINSEAHLILRKEFGGESIIRRYEPGNNTQFYAHKAFTSIFTPEDTTDISPIIFKIEEVITDNVTYLKLIKE